jgi:hypothetical protein
MTLSRTTDAMNGLLTIAVAAALGACAVFVLDGAIRRLAAHRESAEGADLQQRVRERIGTLASHPEAVDVAEDDGIVRLRGEVPREELARLLLGVRDVAGVRMVYNSLTPIEGAPDGAATGHPARDAASA